MLDLDFDKMQGILPAVLQDSDSGEVLMLGFMNREALAKTLRTGHATFFSRTRNQLWTKGETSGNVAVVESIATDCDRDTLLLRVRVQGDGRICHQGTVSCFTAAIEILTAAGSKVAR
ncbi:MAG TPA: phosphoribosyl-AMP cyclohydrolase [Verrucomicrobiae bacterium]|jgi:phosphoribosyl-AMP cyclohydrolase|nr:phosphoribosyl-AMP cyclohydrolase [Verrucomicrobiae bacterium]